MLKAVRKKRAYEDIVKQIRHLIEKGRLKREDQLPTERELSETFKVSRATVREAIFSLETMKLVQRRQGNGTYVIASSEEALVHPLATSLFHEKDDIIDIFSLRKIIEPEVAQLASENRTPEEIEELEEILREQEKEVAGGLNPIQTECRFSSSSWPGWQKTGFWSVFFLPFLIFSGKLGRSTFRPRNENRNPFKAIMRSSTAIKSGNGPAARQAMRRHLEGVEDILFKKRKEVGKGFSSQEEAFFPRSGFRLTDQLD